MKLGHRQIMPGQTGRAAGRELLAQMMADAGYTLPQIGITERGKPYFIDSPIHFSISHTPHHVFCVLADRPVGVDAEELTRQVKPGLAEKILSLPEKTQYEAAEDKNTALLTFWVLKEAAAKASGEGLRGYPCDTEFQLADPRVQKAAGCLVAIIELGES